MVGPSIGAPSAPSGQYKNPGPATRGIGLTGRWLDNKRAYFFELPLLIVCVGYLYNKAVVENRPDPDFGFGDLVVVVAVAYMMKRVAVGRRWKGLI